MHPSIQGLRPPPHPCPRGHSADQPAALALKVSANTSWLSAVSQSCASAPSGSLASPYTQSAHSAAPRRATDTVSSGLCPFLTFSKASGLSHPLVPLWGNQNRKINLQEGPSVGRLVGWEAVSKHEVSELPLCLSFYSWEMGISSEAPVTHLVRFSCQFD